MLGSIPLRPAKLSALVPTLQQLLLWALRPRWGLKVALPSGFQVALPSGFRAGLRGHDFADLP